MASFTFEIIRGSSRPPLQLTLVDASGSAVDLTSAESVYLAAAPRTETAQASLAIYKEMTVTNAAGGVVLANWVSSDTDEVAAGLLLAEVRVTWSADDIGKYGPFNLKIVPAVMQ